MIFNMAKDPVCNMNVDEKTAKYSSDIDGKKVYFCSNNCKQQLEQNPSKYGF
jgi:YHS domain-containing protein